MSSLDVADNKPGAPHQDAFAFFAQAGSQCTVPVTTATFNGTTPLVLEL